MNRLLISPFSQLPQRWISQLLLRVNWGHLVLSQAPLLDMASLWLGLQQAKLRSAICALNLLGRCLLVPRDPAASAHLKCRMLPAFSSRGASTGP